MTIKRINKIENLGVFSDFSWPDKLKDFKKKNLIYGWNGTGKTTLSNLFRSIEKRTDVLESTVEFTISYKQDDKKDYTVHGDVLSTTNTLPQVRVFNKAFIEDNVFTRSGETAPVFYLGEENIEKQKESDKLKKEIDKKKTDLVEKGKERDNAEKDLDEFKIGKAQNIKTILRSQGREKNLYNNYDKRDYNKTCERLLKLSTDDQKTKELNELDLERKINKTKSEQPEIIKTLNFKYPNIKEITNQVDNLASETVVSKSIEYLKNNLPLSEWIKRGLEIRATENSDNCPFCDQPLPDERIKKLEDHFNNQYEKFNDKKNTLSKEIKEVLDKLKTDFESNKLKLIEKNLDEDLKDDFKKWNNTNEINTHEEFLRNLLDATMNINPLTSDKKDFKVLAGNWNFVSELNDIIGRHNKKRENFQKEIENTRKELEEHYVATCLNEYKEKRNAYEKIEKEYDEISREIKIKEKEVEDINKEIKDHYKPCDQLNQDLHSYLDRDDLYFEIEGNHYKINRKGVPAKNQNKDLSLSEGEKTAIAFLYFLISLKDKSFNLKEDVVVIDDPVSSLDSNALYSAFGFMQEHTKDASQLFILTHNHSFFRQVKNWFNHEGKSNNRFYMLTYQRNSGNRHSKLSELDSLLKDYESEYHYLFSLIYNVACSKTEEELSKYYHLPNTARRLLEAFLAFRYPSINGKLKNKLDQIASLEKSKMTKIIRFLNTYSHADQISDPEHDPSILNGTKSVLNDILNLIKKEDCRHYNQMINLVEQKENPS